MSLSVTIIGRTEERADRMQPCDHVWVWSAEDESNERAFLRIINSSQRAGILNSSISFILIDISPFFVFSFSLLLSSRDAHSSSATNREREREKEKKSPCCNVSFSLSTHVPARERERASCFLFMYPSVYILAIEKSTSIVIRSIR
jgi:hypothetical protein